MNNQPNRRQVGRLTGRINEDAGIMRYRGLLAQADNPSTRNRSGSKIQWKFAGMAAAILLLVLALSVGATAHVAGIGCAYLTPGIAGGGSAYAGVEQAPGTEATLVAESGGSLELSAAGKTFLGAVNQYNGELCHGPYVFAP